MAEQYYIFAKGEKEGPYSGDEIQKMLEDEVISFQDYCRRVGDTRRFRLDDLFEEIPEDEEVDEKEEADNDDEEWEEEIEEEAEEEAQPSSGVSPGKQILYSGHPSFLKYPLAWLLCFGSAIGGYFLGPTSLWYFITGTLLSVLIIIYIVIDRTTRHYLVTGRRIEVEWGLIVKSSNEVRIRDVRTVNVKKRGLMGLLGIGTIEFSTVGDNIDVAFADVWAAHRVKRLVREIQDEEEDGAGGAE